MTVELPSVEKRTCVYGGVGSGKTEKLIELIGDRLSGNAADRKLAVFCASSAACRTFSARSKHRLGNRIGGININTARSLALEILSSPEAIAFNQRRPNLMTKFEKDFLFEDMKVCGLEPKRLREMLKFFYRGWSELKDMSDDWLRGSEEEVHRLLKDKLRFLGSMLEDEVSNYAVRFLLMHQDGRERFGYDHVVVDDHQNLSLASQCLMHLIAKNDIIVAGDVNECYEVLESYPNADGLRVFAESCPQEDRIFLSDSRLSKKVTETVNSIRTEGSTTTLSKTRSLDDAPNGSVIVCSYGTMAEEFVGVADIAKDQIKNCGVGPQDVLIIASDGVWLKNIVAQLCKNGIEADIITPKATLKGDIRSLSASVSQRFYTALKLVGDPYCPLAWRCWCGFGFYLANSHEFAKLERVAKAGQYDLHDALEVVNKDRAASDTSGASVVVGASDVSGVRNVGGELVNILDRYDEGSKLLKRTKGLCGQSLLEEIKAFLQLESIPSDIVELCGSVAAQDTAQELYGRIKKRLLDTDHVSRSGAVRVGPPEMLCGSDPKTVIWSGFLNGVIPSRDYFDGTMTTLDKQAKMHALNTALVYSTIGKAREHLYFTYPEKADLEVAEKLQLKIDRIFLDNGERMCKLSPSIFLDEMSIG